VRIRYDWAKIVFLILCSPLLLLVAIIVIVMPPVILWQMFNPPAEFSLKKSEWECVSSFKERVFTGKVWITQDKCSEYALKGLEEK
jgi:hypothetical protein